tara:strand:- start:322 stop:468 length:147 start_codon:yes stop_codon:yes gene_type:complete
MPFNKKNQPERKYGDIYIEGIKKNKKDVLDRFLCVLWRREVDLKLTTK